jgi:phospholipid/cholesterol/gamma-HCH transport system ATP-binding protein
MKEKFNMSSIIITHDISCVDETADRIMIIDEGHVLAEGQHGEVRNNEDPKIRSYFESVK